jgi:hypothetical protein
MVVISAFSLSTGNLTDNFRGKDRSFTGILIVSNGGIEIVQIDIFGVSNQMPVLPQNALRLRPP